MCSGRWIQECRGRCHRKTIDLTDMSRRELLSLQYESVPMAQGQCDKTRAIDSNNAWTTRTWAECTQRAPLQENTRSKRAGEWGCTGLLILSTVVNAVLFCPKWPSMVFFLQLSIQMYVSGKDMQNVWKYDKNRHRRKSQHLLVHG